MSAYSLLRFLSIGWALLALTPISFGQFRVVQTTPIRNLTKDKGPSTDGVCEWTGAGPLQGRLCFCFYTATRGIHTYALSKDGRAIADHQSLLAKKGNPLRLGAPLDIVFDSRGWLYVADFSAPERGDSGKSGGVWLLKPINKK